MGNNFLWILLLSTFLESSYSYDCKTEPRCQISPIHKMKTADCYNRNFKTFPKCIPSDVEVIELTFNRIRKVNKSDLSRFGYLTILYLTDNLLSNLDDEVFKGLESLSTLDLSLNAITKVPSSLFQLPSLNKLYLSQNLNINIIDAVEEAKPISCPLTMLDISLTTYEDNILDFPDFGIMPLLATLNITGNLYIKITPKHFAGLCSLQILINTNVTTDDSDGSCLEADVNRDDMSVYNQCQEIYGQMVMRHRIWKIGIGVGVTLLLLIILACTYFFWIRKKHRKEKAQNQRKENIPIGADGMSLLNNQTKSFPI
ncbi:hypothetical protein NQ314_016258 [Rhamnusium bicolor]|uniref:Uncharacterized protein n=1 Tax=Rhamnusium bicolor TaxID=1586634 RepID=A0AAV8WWI3_9CUCU|nr:hypothetical protein NQ314_016258 [Rhamnusium bicolor]